jgi:quinol monooxygenase YgiN
MEGAMSETAQRRLQLMKYGIYTRHTAKPGQRDNLVANLLAAVDLLRDNPDCIHFVVNTTDEPDVVWVNVVWTSKEARDAALQPEDMRALMMAARPLLSEDVMPEQIFMTPVGGKGL